MWIKVVAVVGAVVVLGGLLTGAYFLVKHTGSGQPSTKGSHSASPTAKPSPTRSPLDISSRTSDSQPLTVAEVFPGTTLKPDPGRDATYQVLKTDAVITSCPGATNGQVGAVLTKYACTQVVRGTLATPGNTYVLTAGLCNMADAGGAQAATDQITQLGKAGKGGFTGLAAPGAAVKLDKSPTLYALQAYGHYVLYVVIGKPDGSAPASNADTQQILQDMISTYLTSVIDKRKNNG